jgi:putative restriction endonuclease
MDPGTLFLFKLHAPNNFVVGGGYFVRFTVLPCFLAWEAFGEKNGVPSLQDLIQRMTHYQHSRQSSGSEIGCNILIEPFFFPEEDWIPIPENWRPNIQRGLTYDTNENYGADLWEAVQARIARITTTTVAVEDNDAEHHGNEYLTRARLGQGSFRILVTDAYHRCCAVTNEKTLPALEAAHIRSYSKDGPHRTSNGLLLRADIHRLFDDGYVTIDQGLRFLVSERVREQFENGHEYYRFHGVKLQNLPDSSNDLPSKEFIRWHNEECFERI